MFEIIVNGKAIQLLQPIKDVKSLIINHIIGVPILINQHHKKPIAEWLYKLTQQVDLIEYNGVLMPKEDINKPEHLKETK